MLEYVGLAVMAVVVVCLGLKYDRQEGRSK